MDLRCYLCRRSLEEIFNEEKPGGHLTEGIMQRIAWQGEISTALSPEYPLCDRCKAFLRVIIPLVLSEEGIIKWDDKTEKWVLPSN